MLRMTQTGVTGALLLGTALAICAATGAIAQNTTPAVAATSTQNYAMARQPLARAIAAFSQLTGIAVVADGTIGSDLMSGAVQGIYSPDAALSLLLGDTGFSYRFTGPRSVALTAPTARQSESGDRILSPIVISDASGSALWDGSAESVYSTPANVSTIGADALATTQMTQVSDIFRSTTGVLSGESRNSGSLNVNIHGMQGMGRVPVKVDGAENAAVVYRGYQGASDRSYVDPDFIGSIAVNRTANALSAGNGGSVAVSTVTADDILLPGRTSGFRLQGSLSGNTTAPVIGQQTAINGTYTNGYSWDAMRDDRPSLLDPTGGSASLTYARRGEMVDIVAGISHRRQGNYYAGTNGNSAVNSVIECAYNLTVTNCQNGTGTIYYNTGLTSYAAGEEVLNTSSETYSGMVKANIRLSPDSEWVLGYSRYESSYGEVFPSRNVSSTSTVTQNILSQTTLDTVSSRLRWNPLDNDLIDLRWNLWATALHSQTAPTYSNITVPAGTDNMMWGMDLTNTMTPVVGVGTLSITGGLSFKSEDTQPNDLTRVTESDFMPRDAERDEVSLYAMADWRVNDYASVTAGLRATYFDLTDRRSDFWNATLAAMSTPAHRTGTSVDPSIGFTLRPLGHDDLQIFASYTEATRLPSIFESALAFGMEFRTAPDPETTRAIDLGVNYTAHALLGDDDALHLKLAYFDKNVDNYIARRFGSNTSNGLQFYNLDYAHFEGVDLSAHYEKGGFAGTLSATYYASMEFCRVDEACENNALASDYSVNHIPPEFQIALDLSQRLMNDALTVGGRLTYVGERAAGIDTDYSLNKPIEWDPYTLVDLYARYAVSDAVAIAFDIANIGDVYYVDPLNLANTPGPGRTARISVDYRF